MGLVNPDIKPLPDDEMREQLGYALRHFASEDELKSDGALAFGRNGPFIQLRLPMRQLCELALKGLDRSNEAVERSQEGMVLVRKDLLSDLIEVHRCWCNYCHGDVTICRGTTEARCSLNALLTTSPSQSGDVEKP